MKKSGFVYLNTIETKKIRDCNKKVMHFHSTFQDFFLSFSILTKIVWLMRFDFNMNDPSKHTFQEIDEQTYECNNNIAYKQKHKYTFI